MLTRASIHHHQAVIKQKVLNKFTPIDATQYSDLCNRLLHNNELFFRRLMSKLLFHDTALFFKKKINILLQHKIEMGLTFLFSMF